MPYDNTNKIAIFKNDKGDNPKRPDYRGTLNILSLIHIQRSQRRG